jgi:hypothetical protein
MDRADKPRSIIAGGPCLWVAADDQCPESATEQCAATDVSEQHSYVKQISAVVELDEGVGIACSGVVSNFFLNDGNPVLTYSRRFSDGH